MERPEVNIYLEVTPKAPVCREGHYAYVLEYHGKTVEGYGVCRDTTFHRLILTCAITAVNRMRVPGDITVHVPAKHLGFGTEFIKIWEKHGWRNAKGEPLANADLWQQWAKACKEHRITIQFASENTYTLWMRTEIERRKHGGKRQSN